MTNIKYYSVDGKARYTVQLSPSFNAEASTLSEILAFLFKYGGYDDGDVLNTGV